ncbi:MAG TPA: TonB family protein [Opitutaceae bacterium]|nr:TonB family protein [Opitutaceae bacterium]
MLFPGDQIHLEPRTAMAPKPAVSTPQIRVTIPKPAPLVLPAPVATQRDERASVAKPPRPDTVRPAPRNDGRLNPVAMPAPAVPKVDASAIVRELLADTAQGRSSPIGPARDVADDSGFDRLRAALVTAHRMPESVQERCAASVQFDLAPNGAISGVLIAKSSGNAAFDRSVLDAFARVAAAGLAPKGRAGRFVFPFRLIE